MEQHSGKRPAPTLDEITDILLDTEPTADAIASRLQRLELDEQAQRALVDHINAQAETIALGELPLEMQGLGECARVIAEGIGYEAGVANALLFIGFAKWFLSDLDESLRDVLDARRPSRRAART